MNPELAELYQQVIIDHGRKPRNFGELSKPTYQLEGFNPLCGDRLTIYLIINDNIITDVQFKGEGCAISMASASLMTEALKGKSIQETKYLFEKFHTLVTKDDVKMNDELGKLTVLAGVKAYPMRVKCATLAWHTLIAAIKGKHDTVSTE